MLFFYSSELLLGKIFLLEPQAEQFARSLRFYYFQITVPSDEEDLPLGVEAINEDAFDLDDLEEDELALEEAGGKSPAASVASTTFFSAVREVS